MRSSVAVIETEELDSRWTAWRIGEGRDKDKRGMMYDRRASTSMCTGISEGDEGDHGKGNEREREDEREWIIVTL